MAEYLTSINSVMEALRGRRRLQKIYIQEGKSGGKLEQLKAMADKRGVFYQDVERRRLDQLCKNVPHQGILGLVDDFNYSDLEDILQWAERQGEEPILLILDGIEDPQNLGAIIRSAECAGIHGIIVPRHGSAEISAAVSRASAGAVEHMHIHQAVNLVQVIKDLRQRGFWIIAADMEGEQEYYSVDFPRPAVLIIGGEGRGVRRLVKENSDLVVRIPMWGQLESLNAATAAALLIYELKRQQHS